MATGDCCCCSCAGMWMGFAGLQYLIRSSGQGARMNWKEETSECDLCQMTFSTWFLALIDYINQLCEERTFACLVCSHTFFGDLSSSLSLLCTDICIVVSTLCSVMNDSTEDNASNHSLSLESLEHVLHYVYFKIIDWGCFLWYYSCYRTFWVNATTWKAMSPYFQFATL